MPLVAALGDDAAKALKIYIKLKTARARYGVRKALSHKAFKVVRVGETTKAACVKPRANPQASVCESTVNSHAAGRGASVLAAAQ